VSTFTLLNLESIIAERATAPSASSYTAGLLAEGPDRAAKKLGEEAVETVIAAVRRNPAELRAEAADLLYHLLVVLRAGGVTVAEVMAELEARTARSGLDEKAARQTKPVPATESAR